MSRRRCGGVVRWGSARWRSERRCCRARGSVAWPDSTRDTRLVALTDLAVGPGLIWGHPRRPWLFARAGANLGIAAPSEPPRDATTAPPSLSARLHLAAGDVLNDRGIYLGRRSTKVHVALYRRTGGRLGGVAPGWPDAKIALVDHRGAKSGISRTSPLVYRRDGESIAVIASKAGQPTNPAWFHNLMANPETTVQIGREVRPVRARLATDDESERFWTEFIAVYPSYAGYRQRAHPRVIPIVILEPRPTADRPA